MDIETKKAIIAQIGTWIQIITPLIVFLYGVERANIRKYFTAKIATIDNEDIRKLAESTLYHVDNLITKEITNADATLKPAIVQAISDGKVTTDELSTLKTIVKENTLKQLTDDSKVTLSNTVADVDAYLNSTVESILANLKLDPTSPVSRTVISVSDTTTTETNSSVVNDVTLTPETKNIPM